jgi:sialate O-acetylesterase
MRNSVTTIGAVCILVLCLSMCDAATNPCPISADLWILAGQSNMQGYAVMREQAKLDRRIMMLNMDNQWMVAQEPVHRVWEAKAPIHRKMSLAVGYTEEQILKFEEESKTHPVGGVCPGLFFAQHLVANGIDAVGLIPSAHGGTSMNQWDPNLKDQGDDSLYGAMINRIKLAGGKVKGLLWYQGESDTDGIAGLYEKKMLNFIDCLRKDVNDPNLPIILVQLGRYCANNQPDSKGKDMEKVRDVQRRLPMLRSNVYTVVALDLPLDDVVHISFEGQKALGRRMAEIALSYVYNKPNHGRQISLESVEILNTPSPVIKLRFNGVSGKLLAAGRPADFELRVAPTDDAYVVSYRTEFDVNDPQTIIVRLQKPATETAKLVYGSGLNPYVNIVDEAGMAVPAFGPIDLPSAGKVFKFDR